MQYLICSWLMCKKAAKIVAAGCGVPPVIPSARRAVTKAATNGKQNVAHCLAVAGACPTCK
ncbi:hypothetical protein M5D96_002939 [Drosophila gunungcola]|uniref:Uncharacterized protein n=1 Tax=Drosophila gunungcola TaxID=103775 RepID=A0A9P9Z0Y5_9MUSC|nr:hypothetical protein M5D96_002939 [Drosophila gunungcola]